MPPTKIASLHAGLAAASKRLRKTTALVSHNATTGMFTVAAGFLNDLAPNDTVDFSALTGGSGIDTTATYYLKGPRWQLGQTTFSVSALPEGPVLTGGTNATAGTVGTGSLTTANDGLLSGNYVSQDSPAGR